MDNPAPGPQNIFVNTGSQTINTTPAPAVQNSAPVIPPPKRKFPKIFVIIGGIVALLIIIVLVARLFTGARKSSNTITWWGLWEDTNIVQPLIDTYQAQHPGVKINYVKQSQQDYRERLTNSLAKGQGPDIFTFHNSWVPMFKNSLDALPATVMNPADFAKTFYPVASSDLTNGTSIVGIPLEYDALTLYINQDIFSKSNVTAPTTWDDFRVLARRLTVKDDQGHITQSGAALGRTENVDHWPEILALLMLQNGVNPGNPTGKAAEDALTFFTVFSTTDGVWDATLPPSTQAFEGGKLAMYIGPSWRALEIHDANPNLKFVTAPIPQLPKDNPGQPDITYATYWAQGVWTGSGNRTLAWDFLKFLSTSDSLQKLYKNESAVRIIGEPYPRVDLAQTLTSHPILGSIVKQAPGAESWYLASRTFDGPTGINTQLANYFGDAVNAVATGQKTATDALKTAAQGVQQVLAQYGLIVR